MNYILIFFSILLIPTCLVAEVSLPGLFSDGMVLQQGKDVPVWGTVTGKDESVTIKFQGREYSAKPVANKWLIYLKNLKAGGPWLMIIEGKNKIELKNVMVGEVWVCSGQSNMVWPVKRSSNPAYEIANSTYPNIRLFTVPRSESPVEFDDEEIDAQWKECNPANVENFSAVAYYFGKCLYEKLNVPIGLINSAVGGTPIEAWMSNSALDSDPNIKDIVYWWHNDAKKAFRRADVRYSENIEKAELEGKSVPSPLLLVWTMLSGLYNDMIYPLQPYTIRGVIWYQGEANAPRAKQYRQTFPIMIKSWRKEWNQGEFPFLFVQLAYYGTPDKPDNGDWAKLREAQLMTYLSVPNTAMAVTTDVGSVSIHPVDKKPVGYRLALAARAIVYNEKIVYSGPIYKSMKKESDKIILSFEHIGSGLKIGDNDTELRGFVIAGEDKKFVDATAKIDNDFVVVSSTQVTNPVAVRYGWHIAPVCNLFNKEDLPASPFRTDVE